MSIVLSLLILITPFAYAVSPYAFAILFLLEAFLFVRKVDGFGNRFLLLMLLSVMYSCISIAGMRLYDIVIVLAFLITFLKRRGHIRLTYNIFPFLALVIIVGVLHSGSENLIETIRFLVCILLYITTVNNEYNLDDINGRLIGISIANIYFALSIFVLNSIGRIGQYEGLISSDIFGVNATEVRLNGFFSDPNKYMSFCLVFIFIIEMWMKKGVKKNILLGILCISSLISFSRTAILSLLAYAFFKIIRDTYEKNKVLSIILGSTVIASIIVLLVSPNILNNMVNALYVESAKLMGREHTLSINANLQSDNRTIIWKQALGFIKEHPIIGYGWGAIRELLPYPTHNTVFELLMDCGIIGLCCYLIFMRKLLFNKHYEYTIPFVWIPILFLDMSGYRMLFLMLGLVVEDRLKVMNIYNREC